VSFCHFSVKFSFVRLQGTRKLQRASSACVIMRLEARLPPNIGNTGVAHCGSARVVSLNLAHSVYAVVTYPSVFLSTTLDT